jgi:hypothetical protein
MTKEQLVDALELAVTVAAENFDTNCRIVTGAPYDVGFAALQEMLEAGFTGRLYPSGADEWILFLEW